MIKKYQPNETILKKYADVLVNFGLNNGRGVKPKEVVLIQVPECAKPILKPLRNAILKAKAHPIIQYLPDDISRDYFELANQNQLTFFPEKYLKGKLAQIDHTIGIIAETNKKELEGIDPKKIMLRQSSFKPYMDWRNKKESAGKYSWTLAMYGTDEMAKEVNMSLKEYWQQIIIACYLNQKDPVKIWKNTFKEINRVKNKLTKLNIDELHLTAKNTDIKIGLGKNRVWKGGSGCNIPSFEIFTSPDWRKVNGKIQFTEPLYAFGNIIENAYLEIKDGLVIKVTATKGQKILKEMIKTQNANKIGEFSLTDCRLSKITKFMGETLFDENVGGKYGNTHLAIGQAYKDCYSKDQSKLKKADWDKLGFNESIIHTDIVATSNRKVFAKLKNGKRILIYKDGTFQI